MTETINGLHKCQPKNAPTKGAIKTFAVIHMPAKDGKKAWIKIKSESSETGGIPYRIVSVTPTGWKPDMHGNVSFNLEIERQVLDAPPDPDWPDALSAHLTDAPPPRQARDWDDRSAHIERQHSQEMALRFFAISGKVMPSFDELREMTSWFQRDIRQSCEKENEQQP